MLINFDLLWAWQNIWGYGRIILVEFGPWGIRTRVMTIFMFFVGPNFPNIGYFDVYDVY